MEENKEQEVAIQKRLDELEKVSKEQASKIEALSKENDRLKKSNEKGWAMINNKKQVDDTTNPIIDLSSYKWDVQEEKI